MKTVFHVNNFISNIKHLVRDYSQICSAPFSVRTISFREELFSKKCFIFEAIPCSAILLKYYSFVFLYKPRFSNEGFFDQRFRNQLLVYVSFLIILLIKGTSSPLKVFFFKAACFSTIP